MSAWSRYFAWSERNRFAVDAGTAALVGLIALPIAGATSSMDLGTPVAAAPRVLLSAVMVGAMAWRRTSPVASWAVVYSAALLHIAAGAATLLPTDLVVPWALWSVTVHGPRWASRVGLTGALVGSVAVGMVSADTGVDSAAIALMIGLTFLTVWFAARARRARHEAMDALIDRAHRLEVERDQQSQLAAAEERARIAREMHDIVAHSLSVIIAQADGGRYAAATDPDAATRALTTIAETGRATLTDMRRLLGVLRAEPAPASPPVGAAAGASSGRRSEPAPTTPDTEAPTGPLPALDDLVSLVERLRVNGLRVSMVRIGQVRNLPPGIGLTLYRIAQESLTNVLKHAGPDPEVTIVLQWLPASIVLEVSDDGRGAAADSDGLGHGLLGMRERATMFAGELSAGPRPGGGFRVRATLPTPATVAPATAQEVAS